MRNDFSAIVVSLGGGDDTLVGGREADTLAGGPGDDQLFGGDGDDLLLGGPGDDRVSGQRDADTEFLGSGDDTAVWNPGEVNDVVHGGPGDDTLEFNGSNAIENIHISASGHQAVLTRDVGAVRMDLSGLEQLHVRTLLGADSVTIDDMTGTPLDYALIDLSVLGPDGPTADGEIDSITVNGTNQPDYVDVGADGTDVDVTGLACAVKVTGADPSDQLGVNTLGGDDTVDIADGVTALIGVLADLGIGQHDAVVQ